MDVCELMALLGECKASAQVVMSVDGIEGIRHIVFVTEDEDEVLLTNSVVSASKKVRSKSKASLKR